MRIQIIDTDTDTDTDTAMGCGMRDGESGTQAVGSIHGHWLIPKGCPE